MYGSVGILYRPVNMRVRVDVKRMCMYIHVCFYIYVYMCVGVHLCEYVLRTEATDCRSSFFR